MRLELQIFLLVLLGLVASSWSSSLHEPSAGIRDLKPNTNPNPNPNLDGKTQTQKPELDLDLNFLLAQDNVNVKAKAKDGTKMSSFQNFPDTDGQRQSRKKRSVPQREAPRGDSFTNGDCDKVTESEIDQLNKFLQGALRNLSSLYPESESESKSSSENAPSVGQTNKNHDDLSMRTSSRFSSVSLDQCQQLISEMTAATAEISRQAKLLEQNIFADDDADDTEIERLGAALQVKTSQLHSLAANLETKLNRNRKWRDTLSRMTFEVQLLTEELEELKTEVIGSIYKVGGRNYNLLIAQIRRGDAKEAALNFYRKTKEDTRPTLVKRVVQDAYDGESLESFRNTLNFVREYPELELDEFTYSTLFEKVNASFSTSGSTSGSNASVAHRSDPRVLLPLSYRMWESIKFHKRVNDSVPARLTLVDEELEQLVIEEVLKPWARLILSTDFLPILEFEEEGSALEQKGFRIFIRHLVQVTWEQESPADSTEADSESDSESDSGSKLQRILSFLTSLKTPIIQAHGLKQLFALSDFLRDEGAQIAFQIKKLLDSVGPTDQESENENEGAESKVNSKSESDNDIIRRDMTKLKAALPAFERVAVWGNASCHIQNYESHEYLYAPDVDFMRSEGKRELFTAALEQVFQPINTGIGEWTFLTNAEDEGATLEIQNWFYSNNCLISSGEERVYLRDGIAPVSTALNHTTNWVIERISKDGIHPFTIKDSESGRYLYSGGMDRAWDSAPGHRRVLTKAEADLDPLSNEHIWIFRCVRD